MNCIDRTLESKTDEFCGYLRLTAGAASLPGALRAGGQDPGHFAGLRQGRYSLTEPERNAILYMAYRNFTKIHFNRRALGK